MIFKNPISTLAMAVALLLAVDANAQNESDVSRLQLRCAEINYQMPNDAREEAFEALTSEAEALVALHPESAELLIWSDLIKSNFAGMWGGLRALSMAKAARRELEKSLDIGSNALQGSAYTSRGTLYFMVPGWPIGFGSNDKAEDLLQRALQANLNGIDPNYFYGEFNQERKNYEVAREYYEKALAASARPGCEIADAGRLQGIRQAIEKLP